MKPEWIIYHTNVDRRHRMVALLLAVVALAMGASALPTPGWHRLRTDPTNFAGWGMQAQGESAGTLVTTNETEATPEVVSLARSLQYDPVLIYDYVRNHVEFGPPSVGVHNGAHGCLLAGRGNDADQATLLAALLRVSGYTNRFAHGAVLYAKTDLANWLGVETNVVINVLSDGGQNTFYQTATQYGITRFWVEVLISNVWCRLDPAFREFGPTNGINLATAMGYSQTQFMASATQGATSTVDYVRNLNEPNIAASLTAYATNLQTYIKANGPNATLSDLLKGRPKIALPVTSLTTNLPHAASIIWRESFDHFPSALIAKVNIQHQGINATFTGPQLAARRLSITYNAADSYRPQLWLDGKLMTNGTSTVLSNTYALAISVDHPYDDPAYADDTYSHTLASGSTYVLLCDFEGNSQALVNKCNLALSRSIQAGVAFTNEPVMAGSLQVAALTGLRQWHLSRQLQADLARCVTMAHHFEGIIGQERGYFVDLPGIAVSVKSVTGNTNDETAWFRSSALYSSALEHGVLEQTQGTNKPCVSTIKLIQMGNSTTGKTFLATTNNWFTLVRPSLTNTYTAQTLADLDWYITQTNSLILPQNGSLQLNQWSGSGYMTVSDDTMRMIIGGNLSGGYGTSAGSFSPTTAQNISANSFGVVYYDIPRTTSIDPIDLHSGDALAERVDLSVGSGPANSLQITRQYSSARGANKGTLGYGWTHNHDIRAIVVSHGDLAFGGRQPTDAVALIVQGFVTLDLVHGAPDIKQWTAAALATKWGMDQAIGGSVLVQLGDRALEFARLPDGSYTAPPGVTASLSKPSAQFMLDERFGVRWTFNTNGTLAVRQDADSNTVRYAYYPATTNVMSVSNNFNRALSFAYSADGLLTNVTDSSGRTVGYQYSASNLVTCIDPGANAWTYTYDTNHWLTAIRDPLTRLTASNAYNNIGQIQSQMNGASNVWSFYISGWRATEVDPQGGRTVHFFDDNGRSLGTQDALSNRTYLVYDSQGHLVTNIDARGSATVLQYDNNHNLTNRIDALTNTTAYAYDGQFHMTAVIDPLGHTTRFGYDSKHHMTNTVDALTNVTSMTYTPMGLLQQLAASNRTATYNYDPSGNLIALARTDGGTTSNRYDSVGNITAAVDADSHTNTFTFDNRRLLTAETDALGYTVSNTYDAGGLLLMTVDRNGNTNQFTYTPTLKPFTMTYPNGGTVTNRYDSRDWLVSVTDPLGHVTSNRYDVAGRKIAVIDPLTNTTSFAFDANGNVIHQTNALLHVTHYAFDPLNRLTNTWDVVNGGTRSVASVFDTAGRLTSTKDADGFTTQFQYDALNRKTAVIKADGTSEHFEYDQFNDLTAFVNGEGRRTVMTYDGMGRQRTVTDPLTNRVAYVFDPVGDLIARTNADNTVVQYQYNAVNSLIKTIYPGQTNTFSYDKNGLLTNTVDNLGVSSFAYDRMNWQTQAVSGVGSVTSTVAFVYDIKGNRTRIVYPGGLTVTNTFDVADRLASVTDWAGHGVSYTYSPLHSPTGFVYLNGVKGTFGYDDVARLTGVTYSTNGTAIIARQYTLDAVGNRVQEDVNAGLMPTLAPLVRRLVQDPADKLTTISERTTPDSLAWTAYTPSHDPNGNMLTDGYGLTLTYDTDNRVTNLQSAVLGMRTFLRNARGQVAQRVVNGTNVVDVLDGTRLLMSRATNGAALVYYLWGNGLIAQISTNGVALYCHADGQGNVLALTTTNGIVTDQWFYSPYGQVLNRTGTTDTPYQWLGAHGVASEGGGINRMSHRFYHSGLMRFVSKDPIGLSGGVNLYVYANDRPLSFFDALGLCPDGYFENATPDFLKGRPPVEGPSFAENLLPIVGPSHQFAADFWNGRPGMAAFSAGMVVADIVTMGVGSRARPVELAAREALENVAETIVRVQHVTSVENAERILVESQLRSATSDRLVYGLVADEPGVVSLTRDELLGTGARNADRAVEFDVPLSELRRNDIGDVVLPSPVDLSARNPLLLDVPTHR